MPRGMLRHWPRRGGWLGPGWLAGWLHWVVPRPIALAALAALARPGGGGIDPQARGGPCSATAVQALGPGVALAGRRGAAGASA